MRHTGHRSVIIEAELGNYNIFHTRWPLFLAGFAMHSLSRGSVTTWLDQLKDGSESAAQELWNRYFAQLMPLARRQLHGLARDADEEDIALSALKSAMLGVRNNRFPDLSDRTGLWPLLVTITARKALNELKRQQAKKRQRASEQPMLDEQTIVGHEPSPDFALRLAESIQSLVQALADETLQTIAQRKLEGYANEDIAKELNVSTRTVVRKLARIRQEWKEEV
jgi:DNA-directed RNA polymerase specialized sigma24 family protein